MEPFDTKVTVLVAKFLTIGHYLSLLELDDLLSLLQQKKTKKSSKMKFDIKIVFCKIQRTNHLIVKKNRILK
jgi:hypothetical protein